MGTIFKIVYLLGITFLLTNCKPPTSDFQSPDVKMPDVKMPDPKTDSILKDILVCDTKDNEMVISDEAQKNAMSIEDRIELQNMERTDCDGKVETTFGQVRQLDQRISVDPPQEFQEDVTFVAVENVRTCSTQKFDAIEKLSATEYQNEKGETVQLPVNDSESDRKGHIRIQVSDEMFNLQDLVNVANGKNLLKISYFGKCQKYRENPDPSIKAENYRCEQAELLGSKEVLLNAKIDYVKVEGTKKINSCIK
jgi:hypothetical protein